MKPTLLRSREFAAAFIGAVLVGCAQDKASLPTETTSPADQMRACDTLCVVLGNGVPFRVARTNRDSAWSRIALGAFRIAGEAGGIAALRLEAAASWWEAVPDSVSIEVIVNGTFQRVPLVALRKEYVFLRFAQSQGVDFQLKLKREFGGLPNTHVRLLLRVKGARVLESVTPWMTYAVTKRPGVSLAASAVGPCSFNAPGTWCGVVVGISPFFQGTAWSPTGFQSREGTGQSATIRITFDRAVADFGIDVYDPNPPGNRVVAYDASGVVIGSVDVPGDGTPGKFPPTIEHAAIHAEGIRAVDLIPATGDYVAYDGASFYFGDEVACDTVTRGQATTCQIARSVESVSGWLFKGRILPKVFGQEDTVRVDSTSTSLTWSGSAVLSGTVSAFVTRDGVLDTLSGPLVVRNRSGSGWRWSEAQWTFHEDGPVLCGYTDYFLPAGARLSANRPTRACGAPIGSGGSVEPNIFLAPDSGFSADSVQGGPNNGLWYVSGVHYYMDRTSEMNPYIRPAGRADTLNNSTDQRVCRRALGLGSNDPVIVNFFTYNTVCQGFALTPMYDGLWSHEGFGTKDPLDPSLANGHEARRRIAARDSLNDPYRIIESYVDTSYLTLRQLVTDSVLRVDRSIAQGADTAHVFVKDNYVSGNKCGAAWVFDTTITERRYRKVLVGRLVNGVLVCL